jgi:hypothetical protein
MLRAHRETPEALAGLLGVEVAWPEVGSSPTAAPAAASPAETTVQALLKRHPATPEALATLIGQ